MKVAATISICLALCSATALAAPAVVVLPFDNISGAQDAPQAIAPLLAQTIERHGWRVLAGNDVEAILEKERVRYLDSLDKAVLQRIVEATGASAVVSGTIYTYTETRNPIVALSARLVRADGKLMWGDIAGISSDETEHILGFGRKITAAAVAADAVEVLMSRFPGAGKEPSLVRGPGKPLFDKGPASFRSPALDGSRPQRVCVLPFDNVSGSGDATRVIADVLTLRLAAAKGFEVVDAAALRSAALSMRIGSFRGISSEELAKLAPAVGTPLFIRGTIFQYSDPAARSGTEPELQVELSLVDVGAGRVLWAAQHARKGRSYLGFLMLGSVTNSVTLSDRVIAEMIEAEVRATPSGGQAIPPVRTARIARHPERGGK